VDEFFAEMIAGEDGEKYRQMRSVLESNLTKLRVLRVGRLRYTCTSWEKTRVGNWAGLHTVSVET